MYFLAAQPEPQADTFRVPLPEGLWRQPDEAYLRSGQEPPTNEQFHRAARIRVLADRKLKRATPQWILDWANHPSFESRNS